MKILIEQINHAIEIAQKDRSLDFKWFILDALKEIAEKIEKLEQEVKINLVF